MNPVRWLLTVACMILVACATPRHSEPRTGVFRPANEQQARGEIVFSNYCSKCHDGGHSGLAPGILPVPDALIRFQVRHGLGVMPAFPETEQANLPGTTDAHPNWRRRLHAQLDDLLAYLDAIRAHPPTVQ